MLCDPDHTAAGITYEGCTDIGQIRESHNRRIVINRGSFLRMEPIHES